MNDLTHILCWDPRLTVTSRLGGVQEVFDWLEHQSTISTYYQTPANEALDDYDLQQLEKWMKTTCKIVIRHPFKIFNLVTVLSFNASDAVQFKLMFPWLICDHQPTRKVYADSQYRHGVAHE